MAADAIAAVSPALSQAQFGARLETAVLRKAMDAQAQVALGLVSLIPQAPALATSGTLGTRVNTFA
ncbi:MAG: putative motility protein [Betaproteobacteria bacterium]|nr:putative motility protein [Betaproteobacteria bacterium]